MDHFVEGLGHENGGSYKIGGTLMIREPLLQP